MTNALEVASLFARLTLVDYLTPALALADKALDVFSGKVQHALDLSGSLSGAASGWGGLAVMEPRALGGPVSAGRPYLVGERGPELFISNSSGRIVPNYGSDRGGQAVHVTVNSYGSSPYELANLVEQALRDRGM